jgi:hypothetical protein
MDLVKATMTTHFSFIPSPNTLFLSHTKFIWMHYTYVVNFEFNQEQQRVKFFKYWKIWWWPITTPIPCSIVENFYSSTKFQYFYQKIKLELPTTWLTQKHLIGRWIWHVCQASGWLYPSPFSLDNFPIVTFQG